ncbi:S1/P1 nuclease [Pseudoxanthomonas sp. UTMC 1351]|uniref:S1/P1 nuclease n=1 Tax=Pseudoxanthomonas sp. UTMC 1351 TaxID=2695853 RepID=UPI0034CE76F3
MNRTLFFLLTAALLIPAPAHAWGALGHRLVARLAYDQLTPQARAQIAELLSGEVEPTLAGIANWADDLRGNDPDLGKRTSRWHYVNIGSHDCVYEATRDCRKGDCVIEAIQRQSAVLADRSKPKAERLQALKFVVHFVGDVHQPLHASNTNDRGGNDFQVNYRGQGSNLHSVWDSGLLKSARLSEDAYLRHLQALPPPKEATQSLLPTAPAQWAEQSCKSVTQPGFYPARAKLDDSYYTRHRSIAEQRLREGGAHLAQLLNATLSGS